MGPPPASYPLSFVPGYGDVAGDAPPSGVVVALSQERWPSPAVVPQTCYDACSRWLEFAVRYASDAQVAKSARVAASREANETATPELEWEFEASMQAIVACATAVEALETMLRVCIEVPGSLLEEPQEAGGEEARMAEVLQRALRLSPAARDALGRNLGEILRFRDLAVGKIPKVERLVLHPELDRGVEWRLAYFRCENALMIVRASLQLVRDLASFGKPRDSNLREYLCRLRSRIEAIPGSHSLLGSHANGEAPPEGGSDPADVVARSGSAGPG